MAQTLFKVMTYSYCRYNQQKNLLNDCLSAVTNQIKLIESKLNEQLKQISQVLSIPSQATQHQMSVIFQQQTQRSFGEHCGYEQRMAQLKDGFNSQISKLTKLQSNIQKLVQIYKNELLQMSKQMTKWESKNKDMKLQVKKLNQQKQMLLQENEQLKDQITSHTAQIFFNQPGQQDMSLFNSAPKFNESKQKLKEKGNVSLDKPANNQQLKLKQFGKSKVNQLTKPTIKQDPQNTMKSHVSSEQVRSGKETKRKQEQRQSQLIQVRIHSQKDTEQLHKWKKLSKKVDDLKGKLLSYEQEIAEKDEIIKKLGHQLKQYKQQQQMEGQQKKKLKTANTTLRGQKTVLQNQLSSIRKQLVQKSQMCNMLDLETQQLKGQVASLNQTIKWQSTALEQAHSTAAKSQNKANLQQKQKIEALTKLNQQLVNFLNRQQAQLCAMNENTIKIQQLYLNKISLMTDKIIQMEMILDQKNECIVKMKTKNYGCTNSQNINPNIQNQNQAYLNELIRVLNKKITDRDEIIRRLQSAK